MKYTVYLNGEQLPVYPARTSRVPFNRWWPGHQRPLDQTEISYFVTFDMAAPATLHIETDEPIDRIAIRPREYGIAYRQGACSVDITLDRPRLFSVEINGHQQALCVFANEPFVCEKTADTLYFGAGEHHVGMIYPKDNQTIILDEGAVVYGGIYAYKVKNVTICGRGILDSSELLRGIQLTEAAASLAQEMMAMGLTERDVQYYCAFNAYGCENLTVDGIILRDSPFWTFTLRNGCRNVSLNNIKLIGQWRYNSDGFDLCNCYDVTLKNSFVRSFDDCVVVRAPYLDGETGGCRNVTVENNVLWCDWGKNLEVWSGHVPSRIENITFRDNYLIHACFAGISIDTWYGSEQTVVEGVSYENIVIDTSADPLYFAFESEDNPQYIPDTAKIELKAAHIYVGKRGAWTGKPQDYDPNADTSHYTIAYRNIRLKNVHCTGGFKAPFELNKKDLDIAENIIFEDCE